MGLPFRCTGVCNGFAIPVAQQFGARQERKLRKYTANCMWLCIICSILLTMIVGGLCRLILRFLNTPEDIFEYVYVYIFTIFLGIPCTILYNILAAIIRSLGDGKTPVVFLAISSVINIALDVLLIVVFHMGVEGPELATVISQGISGGICFWHMEKLCYMGIPMGLQYSVTAIGSLVIQSAINGFGAVAVAGVGVNGNGKTGLL